MEFMVNNGRQASGDEADKRKYPRYEVGLRGHLRIAGPAAPGGADAQAGLKFAHRHPGQPPHGFATGGTQNREMEGTGDLVDATIVNFSQGGIGVRASTPPPHGTVVALRFRMLLDQLYEAKGQVVWRANNAFGIAFHSTNSAMDDFARYLAKLPDALRQVYLADVLHLQLHIDA